MKKYKTFLLSGLILLCLFLPTYTHALDFSDPAEGKHYVGWFGEERTRENVTKYTHKGLDIVEEKPMTIYGKEAKASER